MIPARHTSLLHLPAKDGCVMIVARSRAQRAAAPPPAPAAPAPLRAPARPPPRAQHLRTRGTHASPAPPAASEPFEPASPTASVADPAASTWDPSQEPSTSGQGAPLSGAAPAAPRRIAIFVEPSPFTYVSGYKNRFTTMIKYLVEAGCEVLVVTTGKGFALPGVDTSSFSDQPQTYCGARVVSALSFSCPCYPQVPLSFALSPRIWKEVRDFRPDLLHCSSPGVMVFAARFYAWLLKAAVVLSYHTHVPSYLPRYGIEFLVAPLWAFLRLLHVTANLTLTVSPAMVDELVANKVVDHPNQVQVWKKGVDSDTFHPRFRSDAMRVRLTGGRPEQPTLIYVGRLGYEKNLFFLKQLLDRNPGVGLAFVGDGPARKELQEVFKGTPTVFMGMLHGDDLSSAYASADVFVMPSESETLGFVVLEAMASQLPVVAVRAGGIPDIIRPQDSGVTGYLYEPADVEAAAALVATLAADKELRSRIGVRARQEVGKWDWRAATMHLLNVQYPMAVTAAAAAYGKALGDIAQKALEQQQQQQALTPRVA